MNRRDFLKSTLAASASTVAFGGASRLSAQIPGERPSQAEGVAVLNPRDRVPVSFIIDDSTCLVNLAHFAIPHFHEAFPGRYLQDWRSLPREIPDRFVRSFGEWCHEHGVKGKYSIVPYPACVGWMDRDLPGWSKRELEESLDLVRTLMLPDWDIHPEMVTHTWVINTKTGRPYPERTEQFMENWRWTDGKSVDELADYMSYALRILKNVGLPCEGITTPGGFGNRVLPELSQATLESCRDVFSAEVPHYFRHLYTDDRSVAPRVEYASGLNSSDPRCAVSIIGCTGDWFGGWDGLSPGSVDQFISPDLRQGRLVEVIDRGEPAVLVCHWPGIYFNGEEIGFNIFKEVVRRIHDKYDNLRWLKLSEIARYWAAKELTVIDRRESAIEFRAPFACSDFTIEFASNTQQIRPVVRAGSSELTLREVSNSRQIQTNTFFRTDGSIVACFDLPKGMSSLTTS